MHFDLIATDCLSLKTQELKLFQGSFVNTGEHQFASVCNQVKINQQLPISPSIVQLGATTLRCILKSPHDETRGHGGEIASAPGAVALLFFKR